MWWGSPWWDVSSLLDLIVQRIAQLFGLGE